MHRVKRIASQLSDHVLIRLPKPLLSASLCAFAVAIGGYNSGTSSMASVIWVKDQRDADGTHTRFEGTSVTQVTL